MLPLRTIVDLGMMAMKGYSAFLKAPALLEAHHQIALCHISRTLTVGLPLCRDEASVFYSPSRLSNGDFYCSSFYLFSDPVLLCIFCIQTNPKKRKKQLMDIFFFRKGYNLH